MSFLIFESMFNSRVQNKNLKSQVICEFTFWPPLLAVLVNEKLKKIKCCGYFVYREKICQNRHQMREIKLYMCSDTLNGTHCYFAVA